MAVTYDIGFTNSSNISSKINSLTIRINNSLEITVTLINIIDNSPLGYLSFVFSTSLTPLQYKVLIKLFFIIVELSSVHSQYGNPRIIESTKVPTIYNDVIGGYMIGCVSVNKLTGISYICIDDTLNNAIWTQINFPIGMDSQILQYDIVSNSWINVPGKYESVVPSGYILPVLNAPILSQPSCLGGDLYRYSFQNPTLGNEQSIHFELHIPNSYKEGTDIIPFMEYILIDPVNINDQVSWSFSYMWSNIGDTLLGSNTSLIQTITFNGTEQNNHLYLNLGTISGISKKILSILTCKLTRLVPAGTAYTGQCVLLKIGLHYINLGTGSTSYSTK